MFSALVLSQDTSENFSPYFGEDPPGIKPKIFAEGIISTEEGYEFGSVFSKDLKDFYFGVRLNDNWDAEIRYTNYADGKWTGIKKLIPDNYSCNDPTLSPDENRLYFISDRPIEGKGQPKDIDIWYLDKTEDGWSSPVNAGDNINSVKNEFYISFTKKGRIYFASNIHTPEDDEWNYDFYFSDLKDNIYGKPVRMSDSINSKYFECDAFVSPDEEYIIFCSSRPGGFGQGDLYISFKTGDNRWSKSLNMGRDINTTGHEFCPTVTGDGKYFFYTSDGDIYWVSTQIISDIKNNWKNNK